MKTDSYLIAVRVNYEKGTYSIAKRKISTLSSTGKTVDINGQRFLSWNWLNRPEINRSDLDMWPVVVYGVDEKEGERRLANLRHDYDSDGLTYEPALSYEDRNI
jgi:hypothetical protein